MIVDRVAPGLRVGDLALYLRKAGWQRAQHPNDRLLVFQQTGNGPKIVLASSDEFTDAGDMTDNALHLLAELQRVGVREIVRAVHAQDRDILSVRFVNKQLTSGGIPLDTATRLVSQLRDLLAYAACVEEHPRPYFPKATSIGRKYTENCVFGHTFAGSFGFTIESPTGPAPFGAPGGTPQPFERRVIGRILRGINQLHEAVLSGEPGMLATKYDTGLNANLCELLEETLKESGEAEMEYSVLWSPDWPIAADLLGIQSVRLEPGAAGFLGAVARQLRRLEESKNQTITGKVVALQSDTVSSDDDGAEDSDQVATILWEEQRGRKLRVRVSLEPQDYAAACDAHKLGFGVSLSGRLEKVGRFWTLMAPTNFNRFET